jgi:hypothetical protein
VLRVVVALSVSSSSSSFIGSIVMIRTDTVAAAQHQQNY